MASSCFFATPRETQLRNTHVALSISILRALSGLLGAYGTPAAFNLETKFVAFNYGVGMG